MAQTATHSRLNRRQLWLALVLVLALYVVIPQLGSFHASWHLLSHPQPAWLVLAIGLSGLTYLAAATTYCLLAFRPLPYGQTVLVQLAATFINRLLPGGIGALGANYAYLRQNHHSSAQAGSLVTINNLLGFVGHGSLVALTLLLTASQAKHITIAHGSAATLVRVGSVAVIIIVLSAIALTRRRLRHALAALRDQILSFRQRPRRLAAALLSSMVLTACNVLCLYACALALHVHLSPLAVLLVFSFGISAGTATPTPGGLGGFEAGLVAGFVAYHIPGSTALAIALLYRLISYWLALGAGAMAFAIVQRCQLFRE